MRSRRNRRGTNQFRVKQHGTWKKYLAVYFIGLILVIAFAQHFKNEGASAVYADAYILSPVPDNFNVEYEVEEVDPNTPSEKELIIAYITRLWEKHGTHEVVHAINCFYSESGLRSDAYGVNTNGTDDAGVAQVNSIHGLTVEQRMDWKTNLDKAYDIWVGRGAENGGWSAWYGKACN